MREKRDCIFEKLNRETLDLKDMLKTNVSSNLSLIKQDIKELKSEI